MFNFGNGSTFPGGRPWGVGHYGGPSAWGLGFQNGPRSGRSADTPNYGGAGGLSSVYGNGQTPPGASASTQPQGLAQTNTGTPAGFSASPSLASVQGPAATNSSPPGFTATPTASQGLPPTNTSMNVPYTPYRPSWMQPDSVRYANLGGYSPASATNPTAENINAALAGGRVTDAINSGEWNPNTGQAGLDALSVKYGANPYGASGQGLTGNGTGQSAPSVGIADVPTGYFNNSNNVPAGQSGNPAGYYIRDTNAFENGTYDVNDPSQATPYWGKPTLNVGAAQFGQPGLSQFAPGSAAWIGAQIANSNRPTGAQEAAAALAQLAQ